MKSDLVWVTCEPRVTLRRAVQVLTLLWVTCEPRVTLRRAVQVLTLLWVTCQPTVTLRRAVQVLTLLWVTCQPTVTLRRAVQVLCLWDVHALSLVMGQRESQLCLGGADDDLTWAGQVLTSLGAVQSSPFWEQYKC